MGSSGAGLPDPVVLFTNITERNYKGDRGVVRKGDPFFTIEKEGKSLASAPLTNITARIRGYWKVPVVGSWLQYVDVKRQLCLDPDEKIKQNLCPELPARSDFYAKVKYGRLGDYVPYGIYKSIESWEALDGTQLGCVDTGEWLYTKPEGEADEGGEGADRYWPRFEA